MLCTLIACSVFADGRPVPGQPPLITDMCLTLQPGSRCLLIGANGAGKTTLLKILGGKHMVPKDAVHILGAPPFHDTHLTTSGHLSYIGGNWTRDIAFAGLSIPLTVSTNPDNCFVFVYVITKAELTPQLLKQQCMVPGCPTLMPGP